MATSWNGTSTPSGTRPGEPCDGTYRAKLLSFLVFLPSKMVERPCPGAKAPTGTALNCLVSKGVRVLYCCLLLRGAAPGRRQSRPKRYNPHRGCSWSRSAAGLFPKCAGRPRPRRPKRSGHCRGRLSLRLRSNVAEAASGLTRIVQGLELLSQQHAGFEKVGGGNRSRRQQHFPVRLDRPVCRLAACRWKRPGPDFRPAQARSCERGHLPDYFLTIKNTGFGTGNDHVLDDRFDLRSHESCWQTWTALHVLCSGR